MPDTILIVEDEQDVADLLEFNLKKAGFQTAFANSGDEAVKKTRSQKPVLVLLDLMLPGLDGKEVCRALKQDPDLTHIPIIMLTAKSEETDRIVGLELGAEDYITKPFSPREVVLRVEKVLKRSRTEASSQSVIRVGDFALDTEQYTVKIKGKPMEMTPTEFKLLQILMERQGRVQTRDMLLRDVWDYASETDTRTVDTHVRRLREKLGKSADSIETIRGVGYRFSC